MPHVFACIDGSPSAPAVCDYAAWASLRLDTPLSILHVLDHQQYPVAGDLTGNIGLGSREHLLQELAALDEKRGKLALEQGRLMLEAAMERAMADGVAKPQLRQRHGDLLECLAELEADIRLLVIGRKGEASESQGRQIGSHLESVIRTLHRPILISPQGFKPPASAILAFDGSETTRKGVRLLAASPLFKDMAIHLVMVGADTNDAWAQLEWATSILKAAGLESHAVIRPGEVEPALHAYQEDHQIDLMVMGAYGHSRIRQFLVGSTTTQMLRTTTSPLLLLR